MFSLLEHKTARDDTGMNEHGYIPIKAYLQKQQQAGLGPWAVVCGLLPQRPVRATATALLRPPLVAVNGSQLPLLHLRYPEPRLLESYFALRPFRGAARAKE